MFDAWCVKQAVQPIALDTTPNAWMLASRSLQGVGVYRYADKYGANVDGYSPIYTPDQWSDTGDSYKLGTKGLIAW